MKRLTSMVVLVAVFFLVGRATPVSPAEGRGISQVSAIVELPPHPQLLETSSIDYVFLRLKDDKFLRSDGSAVIRMDNWIQNRGSTPMESHGWCFYWGSGVYSNVFAEDAFGYMDVDYYENYSYEYGSWGLCVEATFEHSIQDYGDYWYSLGLVIDDHHSVENGVIDAGWRVISDSSIEHYIDRASWSHNQKGVVAIPEPDVLTDSYAIWERTMQQAPWEFSVYLRVVLGDQMAVEPLSQGTWPYDGVDIPWENDPYGVGTGVNIGNWGCYLTSGTMAMNYFAQLLGFQGDIDPGDLNSWLQEPYPVDPVPQGYAQGSDCPGSSYCLVHSATFDDASEELFDSTDELITPGDIERLVGVGGMRDNIQNGQLGILNVSNGGYGHFVLATGFTSIGGVDTVAINDPFERVGSTTLLEQYGNNHLGNVRWFSPGDQSVRPNYVTLYANCPVELLVTDEYGRRTGYDPRTGIRYGEIPSSAYVTQYWPGQPVQGTEGIKVLQIQAMDSSRYKVDVIGTDIGEYSLEYVAELANSAGNSQVVTGDIVAGEVDTYDILYDPDVGIKFEVFLPLVIR